MEVKIIKYKKIATLLLLCYLLFTNNIQAQAIYDTLYVFPDTTTFYNRTVILVDDISNLAMEFNVDSSWENYQIEKILAVIPNGLDTSGFEYYQISTGDAPLDSIIYTKAVINHPTFPNVQEITIEPLLNLKGVKRFYVSGFFNVAVSDLIEEGVNGVYSYWWPQQKWFDKFPAYFNVKVVVKNQVTKIEEDNVLSNQIILYQNYPNPFNSETRIKYRSSENGIAELMILNILGENVNILRQGTFQNISQEFIVSGGYLKSGVYFYRLAINNKYISIKKMIILK